MKLSTLGATFLQFTKKPGVLKCLKPDAKLAEGQGLHFPCPRCLKFDRTHEFTLLFALPSVPETAKPPGRWTAIGNDLSDLTLMEIVRGHCGWHGCIREGALISGDTTGDV